MAFSFQNQNIDFKISKPRILKKRLQEVVQHYGYTVGEINYIFCSESIILEINRKYLNHNYYTDVITFPYTVGKVISSDIFVSIPTVTSNAQKFKQSFYSELQRVMVHAILHLVGFADESPSQKIDMTQAENFWLSKITAS